LICVRSGSFFVCFFFQAEDGIRDKLVTGVQTCALPIYQSLGGGVGGVGRRLRAPVRAVDLQHARALYGGSADLAGHRAAEERLRPRLVLVGVGELGVGGEQRIEVVRREEVRALLLIGRKDDRRGGLVLLGLREG